jgi:hypothetical protein
MKKFTERTILADGPIFTQNQKLGNLIILSLILEITGCESFYAKNFNGITDYKLRSLFSLINPLEVE